MSDTLRETIAEYIQDRKAFNQRILERDDLKWAHESARGALEEISVLEARVRAVTGEPEKKAICRLCHGYGTIKQKGLGVNPRTASRQKCLTCDGRGDVPVGSRWAGEVFEVIGTQDMRNRHTPHR